MSNKMVLNIAHRGARSVAPENTLFAAQKAYELGAHMWETDVCVSKDGELIIFHNDSLTLTSDAESRFPNRHPWTYTSFTLEEIKQLDAGSWYVNTDPHGQIAAGNIPQNDLDSFAGLKIPSVKEAIQLTQELNWKVNLEMKIQPEPMKNFPMVDRLLSEIERLKFPKDQFVISSFNHEWLREVQIRKPDFQIEALVGYPEVDNINWRNFEFESYNVNRKLTTPAEIEDVTKRGYDIGLFNIDSKEDFIQFINAGATRIITDYPQIMTAMGYHR